MGVLLAGLPFWIMAHLLVTGDVASFVLFGGLLAWVVLEMIVINRAEPEWNPSVPAPKQKEICAVVGSVIIFVVIALTHGWLGYNVFG